MVAVAIEGVALVGLSPVMVVLAEMIVCRMIVTTIWMGEAVDVAVDASIIEETLVGAGTEVTAVALKGLEHGAIAGATAAAKVAVAVVAGAEVGVGAGVGVVAGPTAVIEVIAAAQDAAAAAAALTVATKFIDAATREMVVLENRFPTKTIPHLECQTSRLLLNQGCLLCPPVLKEIYSE